MILPLLLFLLSPSPDLLVPPAWIAEHGAIAVDVRPAAAFVAGHLPGAVRVAVAPECVAAGVGCVQGELGKAGLAGEEAVVVVGEDGAAVGEALWLLEWAGLKEVKVLDGGAAAAGLEAGPGRREARAFTARASASAAADVAWVRARVGMKGAEFLDLRDAGIWMERDYEAPARFAAGHLPHALPFDFRRWLPGEAGEGGWPAAGRVWETLKELGPRPRTLVDPQAEFVLYGDGPADLQPGLGYLLLRRAGIPVRVFPGGFQEWSRDPANPVVRIVGAPEVGRLLEAENPGLKGDEVARSVVLLDLREPGDFRLEHIPGAYNFPAYAEGVSIEKVVAEKWPRARASRAPVVLYCYGRPCIRSRDAAARLARAGFTNLLWLREGVEAWREAGLPMASAPRSVPRGAPHRAEASRIPIQEDAGFPGPASASVVVYRSLVYHRRRPSTSEEKQMPWIVPIPGTTKLHRLQENVAAVSVELNRDDLREIESAGSQITVQGARYSESSQRMVDR